MQDARNQQRAVQDSGTPAGRKPYYGNQQVPAGGARRDRTDDLLLAKQALSQLSYGPVQGSEIRDQESGEDALLPDA